MRKTMLQYPAPVYPERKSKAVGDDQNELFLLPLTNISITCCIPILKTGLLTI